MPYFILQAREIGIAKPINVIAIKAEKYWAVQMNATFSDCRKYRYILRRHVNFLGGRKFGFFGINPSIADETIDDNTIKKLIQFTILNEGSEFLIGNVFALISTDVNELSRVNNPKGGDNAKHIQEIIEECDVLVPCWGSRNKVPKALYGEVDGLMNVLKSSGKPLLCFGHTKSGDPKHPLMLAYTTKLVDWTDDNET